MEKKENVAEENKQLSFWDWSPEDCPLWVCKHPELKCEDCDILKEYVHEYKKSE